MAVSKTARRGSNPWGVARVIGGIAHLVERLLCKQDVAGSSPVTSTMRD